MFGDTVEILTAQTKSDPYTGAEWPDWSLPSTAKPETADVQPMSSSEAVLTSGTVISRWQCFLEPDTTATAQNRIRWDGNDYLIDGKVEPWKVDGVTDHYECVLKLVES